MARDVLSRLLAKTMPEPNTGCWLWLGCADVQGYGRIGLSNKRIALTHRVSYELHRGPIPAGLTIDHKYRVKACVNPDHLEPVTQYENNRRAGIYEKAARSKLARTHCKHGHEYTPDNLVPHKSARVCRECHRMHGRSTAQRKRAGIAASPIF